MHKYIIVATSHLEDSAEDVRSEIYRAIYRKKKWMAEAEEIIYSATKMLKMEKTLILKHISGMFCLLNSYSKFTRPELRKHIEKEHMLWHSGKGDRYGADFV